MSTYFHKVDFGMIVLKTILAIYFLSLLVVGFMGMAAYSDYGFRGCGEIEAFQCSDARGVIAFAVLYFVPAFLIVAVVICRKIALVVKGQTNA